MIAAPILLPAMGAWIAFLLPRFAPALGLVVASGTAAATVWLGRQVWSSGPVAYDIGGWAAPLGIGLQADGLSSVMLLISAWVGLPVCIYAAGYFRTGHHEKRAGDAFWPLTLLLWAALNGLFLSADVFNLYVCLELMTLAAVGLVILGEGHPALFAGMRYLLAAFVGSMFYLLGVAFLYGAYGSLDITSISLALVPEGASVIAAVLVSTALLLKTALFPLHFWLPRAHASAPAPVSALLSSLVITGSFYLFLRLWSTVFAPVAVVSVAQLIGALGAAAIVWGSLQAIRQQHLKVMIAYSTVAQVGYLFLLVPLVTAALATPGGGELWGTDAWNGGVYHAMSHALAKAAMFLAAGTIVSALGSDRIVGISGIARQLPITTYAFGIAGMTLIGLPPSGGFVGKWLLLSAALESGQWWWAIVMLVGGVLTAGYVFLVLGQELSLASTDHSVELRPVPLTMELTAFALAIAALVLGVRITEPLELLRVGSPFGGG